MAVVYPVQVGAGRRVVRLGRARSGAARPVVVFPVAVASAEPVPAVEREAGAEGCRAAEAVSAFGAVVAVAVRVHAVAVAVAAAVSVAGAPGPVVAPGSGLAKEPDPVVLGPDLVHRVVEGLDLAARGLVKKVEPRHRGLQGLCSWARTGFRYRVHPNHPGRVLHPGRPAGCRYRGRRPVRG